MIQGEVVVPMSGINTTVNHNTIRLNLKIINGLLLSIIALVSISYVMDMNALSVSGFALRDLKTQAAELNEANTALEAKISYLSSYSYLKEKIDALGMVSAGTALFIAKNDSLIELQ
ncbi:hypothetical protein COT94_01395 [Candidatus Falkowbacteria bacterium CG10_big_fil_rev_8_21_14_0_10_37_14]|uniref:Cell division protein FtsL n=1 Tax=Candidatus Falkowbacteria bacterium CG10_big_fil_rev_8_21_14_0_10_37_14 TaxID=1974561 RepID=A0A2M6WU78_9BACT|nr:hypothetical protein [Candidatus Falkowbacteria bacterium]PIT96330.1 MAG: hypothetical protein COT94_01395 [Candidatus Falkowbacteria bacterium CG10_big_fil_rev_8_21_14_0_10_37_14]